MTVFPHSAESRRRSPILFGCLWLLLALLPQGAVAGGSCGNGVLDAGEACDDGNLMAGDCCTPTCQLMACNAATINPISWTELGPFDLGGRVTALAVAPDDPDHLFAGTPAGAMWSSVDGGLNWTSVAPWLGTVPISALAFDPNDAQTIIAGTGGITDGGSVEAGIGILRSTDGGASWQESADGQSLRYISTLLFWEEEPGRLLSASDLGVQLSLDGGVTFSDRLGGDAISALVRDPFSADGLLAAGRQGLYRSDDRGESWQPLADWPLLVSDVNGAGTAALALSSQTPGLLYASVQVLAGFNQTDRVLLLRSTDGGQSFQPLANAPDFCPEINSCGYAQALAIDPMDDQRLLVGGDRLYRSTDGGSSWTVLGTEPWEVHEIKLTAGGAMIAGSGGVSELDAAWSSVTARNDGLAATRVLSLDTSTDSPPKLLIGSADSGLQRGIGGQPTWSLLYGDRSPIGAVSFDPFVPDRIFLSEWKGGIYRSIDDGGSFQQIEQGLDLLQQSADRLPIEPNPLLLDTLYTGRLQLFESTDAGLTWTTFSELGSPEIIEIASSPVDFDRVYFTLRDGGVLYKRDNIDTSLLPVDPGPGLQLTSIFLDPAAENVIYVGGIDTASRQGRAFKSFNFGVDWDEITPQGLPAVNDLLKDDFGVLFAATARGIWRSGNDGFTWSRFDQGLTAVGVQSLRAADGGLFAGTVGRGVFRLSLGELTAIDTIPPGQQLLIDGQLVTTPYFNIWPAGIEHQVEAYLLQTADSRQEFVAWSDGGALAHVATSDGTNTALTAAIRQLFRLRTDSPPPVGGMILTEPASPDGFYEAGSFVSLIAQPDPDHRFTGFTGNLSGSQSILGFAVIDQPRAVSADFEPLRLEIKTEPPGLAVTVDGKTLTSPVVRTWDNDTQHTVAVEEWVDVEPFAPEVLVFDRWSDLRPREHSLLVRRDTFLTDLTAHFIKTVRSLVVKRGAARSVRSAGLRDAPRQAGLEIHADPGASVPQAMQLVRGTIDGVVTTEFALAPAEPRLTTHAFVRGSSGAGGEPAGQTRVVLFNPFPRDTSVDLLLRDSTGGGIVARFGVVTVPAKGWRNLILNDELLLPDPYQGMLSIFAEAALVVSVQTVQENLRPTTFLDPLLSPRFLAGDQGVPRSPAVQVLLPTAGTTHRLALLNPHPVPITGSVDLLDDAGAPLALVGGGAASTNYAIAVGGYFLWEFESAAAASGTLPVAQVRIHADKSEAAPLVQLLEEQVVGTSTAGPMVLPRSLPPSRLGTAFLAPVDLALRDSGFVLTNRNAAAVAVNVILRDLDGAAVDSTSLSVPAGEQRTVLAGTLFPGVGGGFRGVILATCSPALDGVGVTHTVNSRGEILAAGFPALDPEARSAPELPRYFPFAIDGDSWSGEWWLANLAARARTAQFFFYGPHGVRTDLEMETP